jgi:hypothetical protein
MPISSGIMRQNSGGKPREALGNRGGAEHDPANELPRNPILGTWVNKPYGPTAEGRREIAILMSFPPPLILGFIVADRKPVAPAVAIGSYATA